MQNRSVGAIELEQRGTRIVCRGLVHKQEPSAELALDANEARVLAVLLLAKADRCDPPKHGARHSILVHAQTALIHARLSEGG